MGPFGLGFPTAEVDDQGWKLYITSLVMIISAGLIVVARIVTRHSSGNFGWDDATIVVSLIFSLVVSVALHVAIENGYGVHSGELTKPQLTKSLKWFFIAQAPYKVTVCLNKLAAILLYMRIFVTPSFRTTCFVVIAVVVSWSIAAIGATIWQCVPIAGAWDKSVHAVCINSDTFWVAFAVVNTLTDLMVLILPIPPIMKLHLSLRDRLLLCCVFLMGIFVTVTSILRTTSVSNSLKNKADITWNFIDRGMWTVIEANLGIISACLPVLKRPLGRIFPRMFGTSKEISAYGSAPRYANSHNLSNTSRQDSNLGFWRNTPKSHQVVSISGPATETDRMSDEQRIINNSAQGNDSDLDLAGNLVNAKRGELASFYEGRKDGR